jgi:long-chain acyl-CoA synthetase
MAQDDVEPLQSRCALGFDLSAVADRRGDATALRSGARSVSYAELVDLVERAAGLLDARGVGGGDRVFVLSRAAIETFVLLAAAARVGAVVVPGNWRLPATEVAAVIGDCAPVVAFVDPELAPLVRAAATDVQVVELTPETIATEAHGPSRPLDRDASCQVVLQVYTSGTSGLPKGVLLTEANLAQKVTRLGEEWDFGPDSVSLLATPLFHIGGLSWGLISLAAGATLVVPPKVTTSGLAQELVTQGITHAFLVPKMLTDLVQTLDAQGVTTDALQVVVCGAAPVSVGLQQQAARALGCRILQVYGLTETTGAVTQLDATAALDAPDPDHVLRSSGKPFPWVEIEIRHPDTQRLLPPGATGEIWTRSDQNCRGYWQQPSATAELLVDGWLRTGDGGFVDEAGRLHITDRIKDMIVSGGENIYSIEVERALQQHPAVRDVAIVGRPDVEWGETVVAVVELRAGGDLSLAEAAEHVARLIGSYKRPRQLVVVDELPRNANGKILKRDVRALVAHHPEGKSS